MILDTEFLISLRAGESGTAELVSRQKVLQMLDRADD